MNVDQSSSDTATLSCTPTEAALVDMWRQLLWRPDVGVHDNFIDLGGHSLSAARCINRIRRQFDVEVSLDAFFAEPGDIASIARLVDEARQGR
jgi:hypothetical protein